MEYVNDIRNEYGYEQIVDIDSEDYINSGDYDFSDTIFTNGETEVVYYNQADSRWKDMPYGKTGTIGRSGCGPTSLAIVVSTLSRSVNPVDMCRWSYENGYYAEGAGSYHSLIPNGAKYFGLKVEGAKTTEVEKIIDALSNGKLVVAIMGKGHFTSTGHFIVLRGVTEEGKILVADPISIKRSEQEWNLSIILNEARKGADAGGPFWIISN